jgi:hypothetical protein
MIRVHSCVSALCDDCGDGWDEGPWHFETLDELNKTLKDYGWVVSERVLCSDCARKADCATTGHQWDDWHPRTHDGVTYLYRDCEHCMRPETDPPFPELSALMHAARTVNSLPPDEGDPA